MEAVAVGNVNAQVSLFEQLDSSAYLYKNWQCDTRFFTDSN